jgi:serine/threonine protein kinase
MLVDGRYEIIEQLGSGGMCTVYRARHVTLQREVALKVLQDKLLSSDDAVQRFQREAVAVSALNHPNIVQTFGAGLWGTRPYMAMELLSGLSLQELLNKERRLSTDRALPIFKQICSGLQHAHEQGILHRDLKPSNIMITTDGGTKIVDFGIAKILPESGKEMQKLTQTGDLIGTLLYISPEQLMGRPLDARSDLYSLGCLMYEVLEGKPPFTGEGPFEVISKHIGEPASPPTSCGSELSAIIMNLLAKEPAQRIQTAVALRKALDDPASFHPPAAVLPIQKSAKGIPKEIPRSRLTALAALFVAIVAGFGWRLQQGPESEAPTAPDNPELNQLLEKHDWPNARAVAQKKLSSLSPTYQLKQYAHYLKQVANCDVATAHFDESLKEFRELNQLAVSARNQHMEMPAAGGMAVSLTGLKRFVESETWCERERELSRDVGSPEEQLAAMRHYALCELKLGQDDNDRNKTAKGYETLDEAFALAEANELKGLPLYKQLERDAKAWNDDWKKPKM